MTQPVMTKVVYEELVARADLLERPILDALGRPVPTENPQPPCSLANVMKAAQTLGESASEMRYYLNLFDKERNALAQSLRNAAKAYRRVDEEAAEALRNETPLSGVVMPGPVGDASGPALLGAGALGAAGDPTFDEMIDGLHSVEQIAQQLELMDQGASFDRFAEQWEKYRGALLRARARFEPFREWEGDAATAVGENFQLQRTWLDNMARFCVQMVGQTQTIVDAFRDLRKQHVWGTDLRNSRRKQWLYTHLIELESWAKIEGGHSTYGTFLKIYAELSQNSAALISDFRGKAGLPILPVTPSAPPTATKLKPPTPWKPSVRPSDEDIAKSHILKPPARPEWLPDPNKPKPVPTPDNGGSSTPSVPSTPMMPMMPSTPQTNDPALADALKDLKGQGAPGLPHTGGGVKPASVGGVGVPAAPLQAWGDGDPTARPAAAGAGPGNVGRGVPGAGGAMGGGMPAGGAPGQGAKDGGKGKRVQGEEDQSLYTEDRAWTEGVIGLRSAKEAPKQ